MDYSFEIEWVAGKTHLIPDCFSQYPLDPAPSEDPDFHFAYCVEVVNAVREDPLLMEVMDAAEEDTEYRLLLEAFREGFKVDELPRVHPVHAYRDVWDDVSLYGDSLLSVDNHRIIIPAPCRSTLLQRMHVPHVVASKPDNKQRNISGQA